MTVLSLNINEASRITVRDASPLQSYRLEDLGTLTGGSIIGLNTDGILPDIELTTGGINGKNDLKCILHSRIYRIYFCRHTKSWICDVADPVNLERLLYRAMVWQAVLIFGVVNQILAGAKIMALHGALLVSKNHCVLLSAKGGVGKSTTARRWQTAGGKSPADDMILLDWEDGRMFVHPLPTWSRCRQTLTGERFNIKEKYELTGVLALGRGVEKEEIRDVPFSEYFTNIYSTCCFNFNYIQKKLPETEQMVLISAIKGAAEMLAGQFPPRALFAILGGNITETMKGML